MNLTLALLADDANSSGGKLNILGVFDQIVSEGFPALHRSCTLVLRFEVGVADRGQTKQVMVQYRSEDGALLAQIESEIQVASEPDALTFSIDNILRLQDLPIPSPGQYSFHILVNGEERQRATFRATIGAD